MKKALSYLLFLNFIAACDIEPNSSKLRSSVEISVILDITDPRASWPAADQILQFYRLKENPNTECFFRLRTISDKRLSPIVTFHLPDAENMGKENIENDPQFRNKNIIAFYTVVRKAISDFYSRTDTAQSINNSECFRAIADELTFLVSSKSDHRIVLIASDLMEKSDLMNCYTTSPTNPDEIALRFDKANLLPKSLAGIRIIFLFNPRNRTEDKNFALMNEAYKILLRQKGAEIKIVANL